MPRPRSLKPQYCLDKNDGRAYVRIDGKRHWLGRHGSQESRDKYDRLIGEWIARGRNSFGATAAPGQPSPEVTVAVVIAAFWSHAQKVYPHEPFQVKQRPTGELGNFWDALRPLKRLYGDTPAAQFGPLALTAVRDEMVRIGWSRRVVNRHLARLKHVFKWAVSSELVPGESHWKLSCVRGLPEGAPGVRETAKIEPVSETVVEAVLPHLPPPVRAMVQLQLLTGMRSSEVCAVRAVDIDRSDPELWIYRPRRHKTAHRSHKRTVALGPRAQAIIQPFFKPDLSAFLFTPAEAHAWRADRQRASSRTRSHPTQDGGSDPIAAGPSRRSLRVRYDKRSYGQAVQRGCDRAFPPPDPLGRRKGETLSRWAARLTAEQQQELRDWRAEHRWHPHRLRHTYATNVRRRYGAEMVGTMLGDRSPHMVAIYAEADLRRAQSIAQQIG